MINVAQMPIQSVDRSVNYVYETMLHYAMFMFPHLVCYHSFKFGLELLLSGVHLLFFLHCINKISNLELFL